MRVCNIVRVTVVGAGLSMVGAVYGDDQQSTDHSKHTQQSTIAQAANSTQSPGSKELHKAMMDGMRDMHGMKMSGDADHDFASMMIKHHEQAIAMSKVQLKSGKDPEVRKKAQEIMAASEKDIADFKKWQTSHHATQKQ
jgi:uncharacterized protein (DUF305 family)